MSMPGVNVAQALPHSLNQVRMSQSSTVSRAPWTATMRAATVRARWALASANDAAAAAWPARVRR
jgi:hypothetical protein